MTRSLPSLFVLLAALLTVEVASAQQLVNMTVSNQTDRPAQVLWVNGNQRQKYVDLQPGESQTLQTYVGHSWTIVGPEVAMGQTITRGNETLTLIASRRPAPIVPRFDPQPAPAPPVAEDPRQFPLTIGGGPMNLFPQQPRQPQFQPQQTSSVNQGVAEFARSVVGRRIGDGQCTELAIAALRAAGARPNNGYVWGSALSGPEAVQAGDIIQMYDARFESPNGQKWSYGPHTAVVTGVEGGVIRVLEQNMNGGSPVQEGSYEVRYMTKGRIEYYRPVAGNGGNSFGFNGFGGRGLRN